MRLVELESTGFDELADAVLTELRPLEPVFAQWRSEGAVLQLTIVVLADGHGLQCRWRPVLLDAIARAGMSVQVHAGIDGTDGPPAVYRSELAVAEVSSGEVVAALSSRSRRISRHLEGAWKAWIGACGSEGRRLELRSTIVSSSGQMGFDWDPELVELLAGHGIEVTFRSA